MGLKIKYFQNNDFEAYVDRFKTLNYHTYEIDSSSYVHVASYEFPGPIGAEKCLWDLVYLFGTEDWYDNSDIVMHVEKPLRWINKTDVFTLEEFGSYIFGTEDNKDMMGSIFPFKFFKDSNFE
jgi:hypothetical protein